MIILYLILGYWAVGRTIFKNQILIGTTTAIFMEKIVVGFLLGWILIPISIIRLIFGR